MVRPDAGEISPRNRPERIGDWKNCFVRAKAGERFRAADLLLFVTDQTGCKDGGPSAAHVSRRFGGVRVLWQLRHLNGGRLSPDAGVRTSGGGCLSGAAAGIPADRLDCLPGVSLGSALSSDGVSELGERCRGRGRHRSSPAEESQLSLPPSAALTLSLSLSPEPKLLSMCVYVCRAIAEVLVTLRRLHGSFARRRAGRANR